MKTTGYAALSATTPLVPFSFERRALRDNDVAIEILWSGVCHSDLHQTRDDWNEWGATVYPCVPGHEIIGRVTDVGRNVSRYQAGLVNTGKRWQRIVQFGDDQTGKRGDNTFLMFSIYPDSGRNFAAQRCGFLSHLVFQHGQAP